MTTSTTTKSNLWFLGPIRDGALIIGTPLLILPLAWLLCQSRSGTAAVIVIGAFGQLGHCLPGLIRAYGDHKLFRRYRTRFIAAPLALGTACLLAVRNNLDVLILVGVTWAVWHALMQTYGFLRIYNARSGRLSTTLRRLEFGMCFLWFGGAILLNEQPLTLLLHRWYGAGGILLPASLVAAVQMIWLTALVAVTLAYAGMVVRSHLTGSPIALPSVLTMISGTGFYWFAYAGATNILVGAAMFEIFHDVQYLTIVWLFNRRRVEQSAGVGGFVRFLFRRSGALVGVYIGIVCAFGGLRLIESSLPAGIPGEALTALLALTGLLHYYYDGFIWKVRDESTRESLGIRSDRTDGRRLNLSGYVHALKWTVAAIPILWLTCVESVVQPDETTCRLLVQRSLSSTGFAHVLVSASPDSESAIVAPEGSIRLR
ncbi:MAG: hypothetical protein R3C19_14045 [Planctomycetaceae bacterium]